MLQTIVKHYNIGKTSQHQDRVGLLSSHPFTICAVLRVFGRGVESLPSMSDRVSQLSESAHVPIPISQCVDMLGASPVEYVHSARPSTRSLSACTKSFVDHIEPDAALRILSNATNKRVQEPWHWYFGDLDAGYEYLCVLDYRLDPEHDMQRQSKTPTLDPTDTEVTKDGYSEPARRAARAGDSSTPRDMLVQDPSTISVSRNAWSTTSDSIRALHLRSTNDVLERSTSS
jgi:hypothetical protein